MAFDFACPDWEARLEAGQPPMPDLPYDEALAAQAVGIFDGLRIPDIPGQPTFGEASGEWFRDILRPTFGGLLNGTAARLVSELFLLVPKKNSKTTNSAALGIIWLTTNTTPNVKGVIAAPTQEIADTCFSQASNMIALDPALSKLFKVQEHVKKITNLVTNAVLRIQTFDLSVTTGGIPAFVILDELHILAANPRASKILGQLRGGMITNPQSLLVIITTQSLDPPSGVFRTELEYARNVRDGKVKKGRRMLAVLYEFPAKLQADEKKAWRDPKHWYKVLPNLNRSVTLDALEELYHTALEKGVEEEALWASQHLNIEIGIGLHTNRWVGADYWLQCGREDLTFEAIVEQSDVCVFGVDGGGLDDLLGLGLLGRHRETKNWLHWGKAWVDIDVLTRRPQIAEQLRDFEKQGDLVFVNDGTEDIEEVAEIICGINDLGLLPEQNAIGLDPEGVAQIIDALIEGGITEEQLAAISQGYKLNAAIKGTPRKLKAETLLHCNQPLMTWSVGNARTEKRGNAELVTKYISGSAKIDPLMALFDAVQLMSWNPVAATGSTVIIPDDYEVA